MSALLMGRVLQLVLPRGMGPSHKLVLVVLADAADDDGSNCWLMTETIAFKSSLSERRVQQIMADLISQRYVERELNAAVGSKGQIRGGRRPNLFTIHVPAGVQWASPQSARGAMGFTPGVQPASPQGCNGLHPSLSNRKEPPIEPPVEPSSSSSTADQRPAPRRPDDEDDGVRICRELLAIVDPNSDPTDGEIGYVAQALEQKWTTDQLIAKAHRACITGKPRSYLFAILEEAASVGPPQSMNGIDGAGASPSRCQQLGQCAIEPPCPPEDEQRCLNAEVTA